MKIKVEFQHNGRNYMFTFDSELVDKTHYENIWDYWFSAEDAGGDNGDEEVFEITASKSYDPMGSVYLDFDDMYINVYSNDTEDEPYTRIDSVNVSVDFSL